MERVKTIQLPLRSDQADRLSSLYANVFAGEPWTEVSRCSICGGFSATDPGEACQCKTAKCTGKYAEPAYPAEETKEYIASELSKPMSVGLVTPSLDETLGFGWGYKGDALSLAESKYNGEEMKAIVRQLLVNTGAFFYISEVGVDSSQRGQGLGKELTSKLAAGGKRALETVVLRTNENSPMRYIAENLGLQAILGLRSGIRDSENDSRVLFVGGAYGQK